MKLSRTTEIESTGDYQVGDVIGFTLTDGKNGEALAVEQEQDGMVFVFMDCLEDPYPMNYISRKDGGFENSDLRKVLNSEIVNLFPEEIRKDMLAFPNGDLLRIPTAREIEGTNLIDGCESKDIICWEPMRRTRNCIALVCTHYGSPMRYWLMDETLFAPAEAFECIDGWGDIDSECAVEPLGVRPVFKLK